MAVESTNQLAIFIPFLKLTVHKRFIMTSLCAHIKYMFTRASHSNHL